MATLCRDCDPLPKAAEAGEVLIARRGTRAGHA